MLQCSEKKYICHGSREQAVVPVELVRAGALWGLDINVVGQELSASLPSARASGVSKSIGLKATQQSQVWGSTTRTGKASRRLELCLLQLEWSQVLLPKSPLQPLLFLPLLLSLCLVIICLFVSVRSSGKKDSRSYIDLQGMSQVCMK